MTPQAAFEALTRAAGIAPLPMPSFDGSEVLIPSPFPIATAVAAALGYTGAAAAEIWRFRGGDKQEVGVDLKAAAALAVPEYKLNGMMVRPRLPPSAVTGFYQSADGHWLHLHGGFPHLKLRTLDLLNAKDTSASVMEAVAKWNALALEDALGFLGLCGAVARSESEWTSCISGRLAVTPIVLTKVAPAPPLRLAESARPLDGLTVLDLTRLIAGPLCTRLLAEQGADVLSVGSNKQSSAGALDTIYAAGKRQTLLDLAEPAGAEALRGLARHADVFVESYRPGGLTALGFSPAALAHLSPGVITVSISAYGLQGPWAGRRGFEETVETASGIAAEQGSFMAARHGHAHQPELIPGAALDSLTGVLAAAGVLAALLRRIREGGSWHVEVSLAATAAWLSSLGRIDAAAVADSFEPLAGLDQYLQSCETKDGWFEFLGPVVRMAKSPPRCGALPEGIVSPQWASAHEEANAAEIQSAQT